MVVGRRGWSITLRIYMNSDIKFCAKDTSSFIVLNVMPGVESHVEYAPT